MSTIDKTKKPKKGRPQVDTEPVNLRLPREIIDGLEVYRREQEAIPTRPEAIRQILSDWLRERNQSSDYDPSKMIKMIEAGVTHNDDDFVFGLPLKLVNAWAEVIEAANKIGGKQLAQSIWEQSPLPQVGKKSPVE